MSSVRAHRSALLALSALSVCVLAITSCRTTTEPASNQTLTPDTVMSTVPPFQTKEPERYQATRTLTVTIPNGNTIVTRTLIAKDGPMRREEPENAAGRVVYLELPEGRFALLPDRKVYAALAVENNPEASTEAEENSPDRLLHTDPINTTYQALGTETVGGRTTSKFRIVVNVPAAENVPLVETLMWIDEALKMPIRSEIRSPAGTRTLMELSNMSLDPDKQLFQIPADYEKIPFDALQKQLKGP